MANATFVEGECDDSITIQYPSNHIKHWNRKVSITIKEGYTPSERQWIGDRTQLRKLIEALQEFESKLGPKKDDASNLPPMSNKVEGGGHFGLG